MVKASPAFACATQILGRRCRRLRVLTSLIIFLVLTCSLLTDLLIDLCLRLAAPPVEGRSKLHHRCLCIITWRAIGGQRPRWTRLTRGRRRVNVTTFLRQFNVATFLRRFNEALSRAKEIPQCQQYYHQRARKDEENEKSSEYGLIVLVVTRGIELDKQRRLEKEDRHVGKRDAQRVVGVIRERFQVCEHPREADADGEASHRRRSGRE